MRKAIQIPSGWKKSKIKDVALINPSSNPVEDDTLVTFLPMNAVTESGNILVAETRKAIEVKKGFTSFEKGDVLVAKITPCFENYKGCLCSKLKNDRGYGSTEFHVLRPQKSIIGEYLHLITRTHSFRINGKLNMTGTAGQKRVPSIFVSNYDFPLPPLPEQKAIADLLSVWDEAIEKTERLIKVKGERFKWLIKSLICSPVFNRCSIRDFTSEVSIRNKGQKINQVFSVTNHSGFVLPEEQFTKSVASSDLSNYKIVSRGQYAYNPSRINVGSIARLNRWDQGVLSPMYIVFSIDESKIDSDFFLHWLSSNEAQQRIANRAQGSVRETVNFSDFGSIKFPIPNLIEQKQISATLNTAEKEITLLKKLTEKYKIQKRGLMQKLLTGKWRVKPKT